MLRSIRWRLVLSYVFLILLTLSVVGVVILELVEDYVARQEQEYLTTNAQAVAQQAESLIRPVVRQVELQELAQTSSVLGNVRVRILDGNRRVLADSASGARSAIAWLLLPHEWQFELPDGLPASFVLELPYGRQVVVPSSWQERSVLLEHLPPEAALTLLRWQDGPWSSGFRFDVIEGRRQLEDLVLRVQATPRSDRAVLVPIGEVGERSGWVEVSNGPDLVAEALETTRWAFLYAAAGGLLLAVIVGLLVSRGLTAPLRKLTEAAGQMSGGDLSIRAPVRGRDEIGQLAGQFNQMAERLEASFAELAAERDALRRFIADASHELRTPITALKNFNSLLQGAAADDPAARAEFLTESGIQLDRLEWVTHNLLDLSRLDAGLATLDVASCDVGELIEAAASAFRGLAQEKQIAFSIQGPTPPVELCCDRARMEMALSNLLDNAVKFTPRGGEIAVGAERKGDILRVWVQDSGPGIDLQDQAHIFERFYRGQGNQDAGSGLGLAIAQSIIQAHGGQVSVESELGAGSLFVIELPQD